MNTCFLFFSYLFWFLWLSLVVWFNFGVVVKGPKFQNVRNINFSRPGACFSKVPKLFGRISSDIILFVSSKRRRLEALIGSYFYFNSLYNIGKDQLYRMSRSEFYEWLFGPEKFSGLSRNGLLGPVSQKAYFMCHNSVYMFSTPRL